MQRVRSEIPLEISEPVSKFNENLEAVMALDDIRVEACAIANQVYGVDNDAIRPGIDVVGNSYVSFIGYQAKDYAVIGIH